MRSLAVLIIALVPAIGHADKVFKKTAGDTWDCENDPVVRITGDSGTFGFLGPCKRITVRGNKNVLSIISVGKLVVGGKANVAEIEEVDAIVVTGAGNQITWKKPIKGDKPKITKSGRNRVEQKN
ncbi:MAG: DUF3060 domain-containing protein [Kofleriaceae bacterium]